MKIKNSMFVESSSSAKYDLSRAFSYTGKLAIGSLLFIIGCEPQPLEDNQSSSASLVANDSGGLSGGGLYNGFGAPGGLGWNGLSGAMEVYKGIGWNNSTGHWVGKAWGGESGSAVDCGSPVGTIANDDNTCTTIHNAFNHSDVDGNGTAGTANDKQERLSQFSHWVACACAQGVSIPFNDTHGWLSSSTTFDGRFGLAPTWCGSDTTATVSEAEKQIVSACMLALQNVRGKNFAVSVRAREASTAFSPNEKFVMPLSLATYWGNLWKAPHSDNDTTTLPYNASSTNSNCALNSGYSDCNNLDSAGGGWWNLERFSCKDRLGDWVDEQYIFGRDCGISNCGGMVEHIGMCNLPDRKRLGGTAHVDGGVSYLEAVAASESPWPYYVQTTGGSQATYGSDLGGSTTLDTMAYRGKTWRAIRTYGPVPIALEDPINPNTNFPSSLDGMLTPWTQQEPAWGSTISAGQSVTCSGGAQECEGKSGTYRKLTGLTSSQWISINQSGWVPGTPAISTYGDGTVPVTLAIRYSRGECLGDGQCDPDSGCAGTSNYQCCTWTQNADGSCSGNSGIGGTANPGELEVAVMSNKRNSTSWAYVQGTWSPYTKNIFPTTGSNTKYNVAYIYPVYVQNSFNTINGSSAYAKPGSNTNADTLRAAVRGHSAGATYTPHLDTAYFFAGTPAPTMNCVGPGGCWIWAGPNQSFSGLAAGSDINVDGGNGSTANYTTPTLPKGTYTVQMKNVTGDPDLYVKVNGVVSTSNWTCRPYLGSGATETCTITLTQPGYMTIMVHGFAGPAGGTVVGSN